MLLSLRHLLLFPYCLSCCTVWLSVGCQMSSFSWAWGTVWWLGVRCLESLGPSLAAWLRGCPLGWPSTACNFLQITKHNKHNRRSDGASCAENGDNCRHLKIIREKSDFWCSDWSLTSDWLDFYWRRFLFLCKRGIRYLSIGNTPLQAGDMSTIRPPAVIVFGDVFPLPWYTKKEYRNLYTETTALLRLFFSSLFPFLRASMEFIKNNTELYAM